LPSTRTATDRRCCSFHEERGGAGQTDGLLGNDDINDWSKRRPEVDLRHMSETGHSDLTAAPFPHTRAFLAFFRKPCRLWRRLGDSVMFVEEKALDDAEEFNTFTRSANSCPAPNRQPHGGVRLADARSDRGVAAGRFSVVAVLRDVVAASSMSATATSRRAPGARRRCAGGRWHCHCPRWHKMATPMFRSSDRPHSSCWQRFWIASDAAAAAS